MHVQTSQETLTKHEDEIEIRRLFQSLVAAWGAGDATAYSDHFTEDADYIAFDGVNQKGKKAILAAHQPLFERFLKGSRLVGEITGIRFPCPNVALIHAAGNTVLVGKTRPSPERASVQTLVAVKQDGEWRFTAFHNTRVRPIGGSFGGIIAWLLTDLVWKLLGPKK